MGHLQTVQREVVEDFRHSCTALMTLLNYCSVFFNLSASLSPSAAPSSIMGKPYSGIIRLETCFLCTYNRSKTIFRDKVFLESYPCSVHWSVRDVREDYCYLLSGMCWKVMLCVLYFL